MQTVRVKLIGFSVSETAVSVMKPEAAFEALKDVLADSPQEELWVLYLNTQNGIIARQMVARGMLNTTSATPREVFCGAILANAKGIILAHNHPSGSLQPSPDDCSFTARIKKAGQILGIDVYDHVILAGGTYVSLRELGVM